MLTFETPCEIIKYNMTFQNSLAFAKSLDEKDSLRHFQQQFHFPIVQGKKALYFTGNSLGLQPKSAKEYVLQELDDWAKFGVEGHFYAKNPWYSYHEMFALPVSKIVGALPQEVVVMNNLTVNLNLLMVSFYRPTEKKYKIICEAKAFPSDQYALEMQVKHHGLNPDDAIVEIFPRVGEHIIRDEDIISKIKELGEQVALVMIGGVNYYTGQVFDMQKITEAAHEVDAYCGFDLAHGTGNIVLNLHDWNVDFACWCSYKYLNSGPGGVSGVYIHEKHAANTQLIRFAGWWGHDKSTRFLMQKGFQPIPTAEGWQMSNAPVVSMAIHKASLDIFNQTDMISLREKSELLTDYMEYIIQDVSKESTTISFEIITPKEKNRRGCQLSLLTHGAGKSLFDKLTSLGVIADWREPNVIRVAPVPLYNSFEDIFNFGQALKQAIMSV
jgi:kynureninase